VQKRARAAYRLFQREPSHPALRFKLVHPSRPLEEARRLYRRAGRQVAWPRRAWSGSRVLIRGEEDDRESVALSTNRNFMDIIERSRASAREKGTVPLAEVRERLAPRRKPARRGKRRR